MIYACWRPALLGILMVGAAVALTARGQQATFRATVDVVAIDVTVVDASGQPIEALGPGDFTVTVDRKPRAIVSATYISHGVRQPRGAAASGIDVLDRRAGLRADAVGRNVILVIDDDSIEAGIGLATVRAARAFVDSLPPADRVAIATIPRLGSGLMFEADRAKVRQALSSVITQVVADDPSPYRIGLREAYDVERGDGAIIKKVIDRECRCDYQPGAPLASPTGRIPRGEVRPCEEACALGVIMDARQLALRAHMRAQRSLDALRDLADALSRIKGPKTVVFVSGGLGVPETPGSFDPLEPALAAGQMSLYALHLEQSQFGQVRNALSPTAVEDDRLAVYGLENLTSAAGGTLIPVVGTIEAAFDRVATEMSGSYVLGLEVAPEDRDGKAHLVQVTVNRRNSTVRARRFYVIAPEKRGDATAPPSEAANARPRPPRRTDEPARSRARAVDAVTPELVTLLTRTSEYVANLAGQLPGVACEERYEQTLSRWQRGAVIEGAVSRSTEGWFVEKRRRLRSQYVLAQGQGSGWAQYRDVLDVDGGRVRADGRLTRALALPGAEAFEQARQITGENARYYLGYGERKVNVPTLALAFVDVANRSRFFFHKGGKPGVEAGQVWQVDYEERSSPTVFAGRDNRDFPVEGSLWIAPESGTVLRTAMRMTLEVNLDQADVEILVTYSPSPDLGGLWLPSEMRETYTTAATRLECVAQYANWRLLPERSR